MRNPVLAGGIATIAAVALGAVPAAAGAPATQATTAGTPQTPATTAGTPAESAVGTFSYGPITIQINAQRAATAPADAATGNFTGTLALGSVKVGDFAGPVTCLDVEGYRVGLFYPVTSADPSVIAGVPFGVMVSVQLASNGKPDGLTFIPEPVTHVSSCAPGAPVFPVTSGSLTVTPSPSGSAQSAPAAPASTLEIANGATVASGHHSTRSENLLVTSGGFALYTLSGETPRRAKCTMANGCFKVWRPLTTTSAKQLTKAAGVAGKLGVWHRNGFLQVTLGGHPLYTFAGDTQPDSATGAGIHSFGGTWRVIKTPKAQTPTAPPPVTPTAGPPPGPIY